MNSDRVLSIFKETGALLEGHFLLTSGLHSNQYFQCAKVLQYPGHCESLCGVIAAHFRSHRIDLVIAPALGGIVVGQEVGRQLGVRTIFAERKDGAMQVRRGFEIAAGERVLVCEDVVTTGGSVQEVINLVLARNAVLAGVACIVDRSGGTVCFDHAPEPLVPVLRLSAVTYTPDNCPLCTQGIPAVKPGSRGNA
jgi:orotate phosphoribosyltransferase